MRNPKKGGRPPPKGGKAKAAKPKAEPVTMETDTPAGQATVWRPGIDPVAEDEELDYDPTAYDCLHRLQLDWPCLSFDIVRDELGAPRATFPHTMYMVAGTQASSAKQNYVAFVKLDALGQGRHGKKAKKGDEDDEDEDDDDMSSSDDESVADDNGGEPPPKMHYRMVNHGCGVNRVRSCPQRPSLVAVWGDNGQVKMLDGDKLLKEMATETEPSTRAKARTELKPLASHTHSMEGYAMDWSAVHTGRFASGDCNKKIHVWEPQVWGPGRCGKAPRTVTQPRPDSCKRTPGSASSPA